MVAIHSTPHDAVFKTYLTHKATAQDFLQIHLPPMLLQGCNLATLKLESGSFVEENLRAFYSDILYSMQTASGKGYIYALIEHQSSPDQHMTFRLMRYAIAAMQRHLDKGHSQLPVVIPVLFYHGIKSPYPFSMNWLHSFSDPQLAQQVYTGSFPLADITVISDDDIDKHRSIAVLETMQKHIRDRDLMAVAGTLGRQMSRGYNTQEQLKSSMEYLLEAGETEAPLRFVRTLLQHVPQHEELMMTIAQKLRQEGRQEGRQEVRLEMLRTMLASGMDQRKILKMFGLTEEELKQLRH